MTTCTNIYLQRATSTDSYSFLIFSDFNERDELLFSKIKISLRVKLDQSNSTEKENGRAKEK